MAAQRTPPTRARADDDLYASAAVGADAPKSAFPAHESPARNAYALVHDELMLDGNSRQNLATFCQTWVEPEVHKLMDECIDKNMVDKDEYPQTAEIEARCVHMLADLWNSPAEANTRRLLDHRFERGGHAGRHGDEAPLGSARGRPPASRSTSPT